MLQSAFATLCNTPPQIYSTLTATNTPLSFKMVKRLPDTATWKMGGTSIDLATARQESYARPAALPQVQPADIYTDLARRDFSINAMALCLAPQQDVWLDRYNGQQDIQKKQLCVLHPHSFQDDPTRLFRAARYAARFGFCLAPETFDLIPTGLPHLTSLSGERIKYELELIFQEPEPEHAIALLQDWQIFRALHWPLPDMQRVANRFARLRDFLPTEDAKLWVEKIALPARSVWLAVCWGLLIYNAGQLGVSQWAGRLPFVLPVREALVSLGALATLSSGLFGQTSRASDLDHVLRSFDGIALLVAYLCEKRAEKKETFRQAWLVWRWHKLCSNGDTLKAYGVPVGKRYAALLARLRAAWIDREVASCEEEKALLEKLLLQEQSGLLGG